jgi:hypothetical protein
MVISSHKQFFDPSIFSLVFFDYSTLFSWFVASFSMAIKIIKCFFLVASGRPLQLQLLYYLGSNYAIILVVNGFSTA